MSAVPVAELPEDKGFHAIYAEATGALRLRPSSRSGVCSSAGMYLATIWHQSLWHRLASVSKPAIVLFRQHGMRCLNSTRVRPGRQ